MSDAEHWFQTHRAVVHPWLCDQFGHLNVRHYAALFDDAGFALWPMAGCGIKRFAELGVHTVVAHTSTDFIRELVVGQMIVIRSRFTKLGTKSVHYEQELRDADDDQLHARQTAVEVFFDPQTRAALPIPPPVRETLAPLGV